MKTIEDIREAAKTKLVGYTEKEIESFVQGAMFMAGQLPQKRSEEWYRQRDERNALAAERADAVCDGLKEVSGLKKALDNIRSTKTEAEVVEHTLKVFLDNMIVNPEYRAIMLDKLEAEEKMVSSRIIKAVMDGCAAFNETHNIKLGFRQLEENNNGWTLFWEEEI